MKNRLAEIAKHLVDYPEQITANEIDGGRTLVLELSVAKPDVGKIIGIKERSIGAIRTIMYAASAKIDQRVIVELLE